MEPTKTNPLFFVKNPLNLWAGGPPKNSKNFKNAKKILSGQPNQTRQPTPPAAIPDLAPPQPRRKHVSKMIPTHSPTPIPNLTPPTTTSITPNPRAAPPTQPFSVSNPAARRPDPPPRPQQTQRHPRPDGTNQNEPLVFRKNPLKLWVGGRGGGRAPKNSKKFARTRKEYLAANPTRPANQPRPPHPQPCSTPTKAQTRRQNDPYPPSPLLQPSHPQPPHQSPQTPERRRKPTRPRLLPQCPPSAGADPPPRPQQTHRHPRPDGANQNEPLVFREKPP